MPRATTKSFIHELPLQTTPHDRAVLNVRLDAAKNLYNACLQETLRRADLMKEAKAYQAARSLPRGKERTAAFSLCKTTHAFSEYALHAEAAKIAQACWIGDHLDSLTIQKISSKAFAGVAAYVYGKKGRPRFKRRGSLVSVEGKTNTSGIRWKDGQVWWNGLKLQPVFDFKDKHGVEAHALTCRIKYVRLVKRTIRSETRWFVQLVVEGTPLQKAQNLIGTGSVALDIGPSTVAGVSETEAFLVRFCDQVEQPWRELKILQRQQDRSRRNSNPDNYNSDGTIKKGSKKWVKSHRYLKQQQQLAEAQRKVAATRKKEHGTLSNKVIGMGTIIKTEKLSYKSLQKNYGRSVTVRAPGMFVTQLTRKAENAGGVVDLINTRKTRLSQVCLCDNVKKKSLEERIHSCACGLVAQRDLFSAFLALYCNNNLLDIAQARSAWPTAESLLQRVMSRLSETANQGLLPKSFGVAAYNKALLSQSCSPVEDEAIYIEAVDDVTSALLAGARATERYKSCR